MYYDIDEITKHVIAVTLILKKLFKKTCKITRHKSVVFLKHKYITVNG